MVKLNNSKKIGGVTVLAFMIMSDTSGNKLYIREGGCRFIEKGGKSGTEMMK